MVCIHPGYSHTLPAGGGWAHRWGDRKHSGVEELQRVEERLKSSISITCDSDGAGPGGRGGGSVYPALGTMSPPKDVVLTVCLSLSNIARSPWTLFPPGSLMETRQGGP